jgi:hypothetical protein
VNQRVPKARATRKVPVKKSSGSKSSKLTEREVEASSAATLRRAELIRIWASMPGAARDAARAFAASAPCTLEADRAYEAWLNAWPVGGGQNTVVARGEPKMLMFEAITMIAAEGGEVHEGRTYRAPPDEGEGEGDGDDEGGAL